LITWARSGGSARQPEFTTGTRPAGRDARIVIGDFTTDTIGLPGGGLDVALPAGDPAPGPAMLRRWLRAQAGALTTVYDRLPVPRVQVRVVPVGRGGEPVPWGQVSRGGVPPAGRSWWGTEEFIDKLDQLAGGGTFRRLTDPACARSAARTSPRRTTGSGANASTTGMPS
jgi:hypothetical protein